MFLKSSTVKRILIQNVESPINRFNTIRKYSPIASLLQNPNVGNYTEIKVSFPKLYLIF